MRIGGMSCAGCALKIEDALKKIEGVDSTSVNLATGKASVEYDPQKVKFSTIEEAIVNAGYQVLHEELIIKIGGMTCAMCAKTIESRLRQLEGVSNATVNLGAEKAYIYYNSALTSIRDIKVAIEELGYEFIGVEGKSINEKLLKDDLESKKRRIIAGFGVSIILMILMYLKIPPIFMDYFMLLVSVIPFIYVSQPIFNAALR